MTAQSDWSVGMSAGHRGPPFMVLLPAQVVLGAVRKLDKHRHVSKPANSVPRWFLLQAPALSSLSGEIQHEINHSLPKVALAESVFIITAEGD